MTRPSLLAGVPREYLELLPDFLLCPNPDIYLSDNFVVFDLETNTKGHDNSPMPCWQENSVVCGSWVCGPDGEVQHIDGNELELGPMIEAMEKADFIVAHNGKFDLGWMLRAGMDISKVILYDTMIGEYVWRGNRPSKGKLSLEYLCQRELGYGKQHYIAVCMSNKVDPEDMPRSKLLTRSDEDVLMTRALFIKQRKFLKDKGLDVVL